MTDRPVWSAEDRGYALAWAAEQAETCDGCNQPLAESMDPGSQFAYVAEPVYCHGCATRERAQQKVKPTPGLRLALRRR